MIVMHEINQRREIMVPNEEVETIKRRNTRKARNEARGLREELKVAKGDIEREGVIVIHNSELSSRNTTLSKSQSGSLAHVGQ